MGGILLVNVDHLLLRFRSLPCKQLEDYLEFQLIDVALLNDRGLAATKNNIIITT